MKSFKTYLVEADTSGATNAEMAIVYAYNRKQGMNKEDALSKGEIDKKKFSALDNDLLKVGKNVAKGLGNVGSHMVHAGSSSASTKYEFGRDTTSKSDLYGNNKNRFSLKKAGDSGSGAQLMSAKSGEATGVVNYALKHLEKNNPKVIVDGVGPALNILRNEMLSTARNDLYVEVKAGKEEFQAWWKSNKNPRYKDIEKLVKKKKITKDNHIVEAYIDRVAKFKAKSAKPVNASHIQDHLHGELSLLGAAVKTLAGAEQKIIKDKKGKSVIKLPKRKDIDKLLIKFQKSNIDVGGSKVSAKYLEKIDPKKLKAGELRKQIVDVINVALDAKGWKETLSDFFENNEELKKWVVYEAASGYGKFLGDASDKKIYTGDVTAVANKMLVFSDSGIEKEINIFDWSMKNSQLVDKISISYKGSGTSKYIKMGLSSEKEYHNPSMLHEQVQTTLDDIIYTELRNFEESLYRLDEGFFDKIKSGVGSFVSAVKNLMEKL